MTTTEMRVYFRDRLTNREPKCANCKHMGVLVNKTGAHKPTLLEDLGLRAAPAEPPPQRINGKGACMEPSVAAAYPQLFYVTDLMLCSLWERKE